MLETNFQSDENNFIVCYFFLWLLIKFLLIRIWRSDLKNNLKWVIVIREFYCYKMERVSANFQLEWALNGLSNISLCPKCRDKENFYNHILFIYIWHGYLLCILCEFTGKITLDFNSNSLRQYVKLTMAFWAGQVWYMQ